VPQDPLPTLAEALYGLTPGEFTPARDAEAKAVRADGDRALADRVKRLRKPSAAAWVVNMLMRHRQEQMLSVLDLGESLRRAQADLDGDALRELTRQRRRLIAAVTGDGTKLARELGQKVSDSVARQVEQTLHAAMVDTDAAAAVRTGMLVEPLAPAGLGTLRFADALQHTALGALEAPPVPATATSAPRGRLTVVRDPSAASPAAAAPEVEEDPDTEERRAEQLRAEELRRARAAAEREIADAETELDEARDRWRVADALVAEREARGLQLVAEAEELRRRLAEVEFAAETVEDETSEAEERRERAATRVGAAEQALTAARGKRDLLD